MDDMKRRAAERRARLDGGRVASREELDKVDRRAWREAGPSARLEATRQLALEFLAMRGFDGTPPGLPGSPAGVRRRGD